MDLWFLFDFSDLNAVRINRDYFSFARQGMRAKADETTNGSTRAVFVK